jgi:cytochrome c-type biogenesis protein CcsB
MKSVLLVVFALLFLREGSCLELKHLPIQDAGRIKPLDSFARETLTLLTGRPTYQSEDPSTTILFLMIDPNKWQQTEFIEIKNLELKKNLKLSEEETKFSYATLRATDQLANVFQDLVNTRKSNPKLRPYYQAAQRLENQLQLFLGIMGGDFLPLIPMQKIGSRWKSPKDFNEEEQRHFMGLINYVIQDKNNFWVNPDHYYKQIKNLYQTSYPDSFLLELEVFYNEVHFFKLAWLLYAASIIAFLIFAAKAFSEKINLTPSIGLVGAGLILHSIGFLIRIIILGRPPVSNMYETVIWVSWGAVFFGLIIEFIFKLKYTVPIGALMGLIALIISDSAPSILNPSLHPLEPVLRSQLWLTIHVMVITISYSAFLLAMGLGHLALYHYAMGESQRKEIISQLVNAIYRCLQFGVALLAPGIILGGVWADYSWGRFWGWDPKETWALIVLLGYITLLHGKVAGWIKGFGLVVGSILLFNLVIMAWYGVNYILGAGLHTYGFGAGGVEYVVTAIVLDFLLVMYLCSIKKINLKEARKHNQETK